MFRFVILEHTLAVTPSSDDHWDVMLQARSGLLHTWRVATNWPMQTQAQRLSDHRAMYLDFEGPISGQRGWVRQIDAGTYREFVADAEGLPHRVELNGSRFQGTLSLCCDDPTEGLWRLVLNR